MIIINGMIYEGDSLSVSGGVVYDMNTNRVVEGRRIDGTGTAETRIIDQTFEFDSSEIEKLYVQPVFADVTIVRECMYEIERRFRADIITVKVTGSVSGTSGKVVECRTEDGTLAVETVFNGTGRLNIEIQIPTECYTDAITVKSVSGNVKTSDYVYADDFKISSISGDIFIGAICDDTIISSVSGNIYCRILASSDVEASTVSGNIKVDLCDVFPLYLTANSTSGRVINSYQFDKNDGRGEEVSLNLTSVSGDILVSNFVSNADSVSK